MHLIMTIIIITIAYSKETISQKISMNYIDNVSSKIDEYNLDDRVMESRALNEGFLLPSKHRKRSSAITPPTPADSLIVDRDSPLNRNLQSSIDNDGFFAVDDEHLSKELINIGAAFDGSGETTELTSEATVQSTEPTTNGTIATTSTTMSSSITTTSRLSTTPAPEIVLSEYTKFLITVDCVNANVTLMNILTQFNERFTYSYYNVTFNNTNPACLRSLNTTVFMTFFTSNNITILTNLFQILENIVSSMGIELYSVDTCGTPQIIPVITPTLCYLIDECDLCGTNPPRGACLPERNVSKCQCFIDENNPSITYVDEFCKIPRENQVSSSLATWVPIVVGILSGIAGLLCVIISCFSIRSIYRRRHSQKAKNSNPDGIQFGSQWYLPRARITTSAAADPTLYDTNRLISTSPNIRSNSEIGESDVGSIKYCYDPVNQLDAILDNEDLGLTLYESSDRNSQ